MNKTLSKFSLDYYNTKSQTLLGHKSSYFHGLITSNQYMHFQKSTQFLMLQTFQISFFYVKIGQWYFLNFLILGRLLHKIHQRRTQKVLQDKKRKKERERRARFLKCKDIFTFRCNRFILQTKFWRKPIFKMIFFIAF